MDLWTWIAQFVVERLQQRFQLMDDRCKQLYALAKRAHGDAGACSGANGGCQFCKALEDAMSEKAG